MKFSGLVISIKSVSCPNYFWLVENILESTRKYEHLRQPIFSAFGFAVTGTGASRVGKTKSLGWQKIGMTINWNDKFHPT